MTDTKHSVGARYRLSGNIYELSSIDNGIFHLQGTDQKQERFFKKDNFFKAIKDQKLVQVSAALSDLTEAHYLSGLNESQKKQFDRRFSYVTKAQKYFYDLTISKKYFKDFITAAGKELNDPNPPSFSTLNRWFTAYKNTNFNPASLLSGHDKGKKRKRQMSPDVLEKMNTLIREEYLQLNKPSMRFVYDLFENQLQYENHMAEMDGKHKIPSYMTFVREIRKLPTSQVYKSRYGKHAAKRALAYGKSLYVENGLCTRVEADCNYMDIQIVDEESRLIGRPYLLALIDVYSRCIIGWDLSFIPPCAEKVLKALKHAGIKEDNDTVKGLPIELIVDNGPEFVNDSLTAFARYTGMTIRRAMPRSPNQKAHIESFFRTMNKRFLHQLSGTTFSNITDRGDYPSEKEASLTLSELQHLFEKWIDLYHQQNHSGLDNKCPITVWKDVYQEFPTKTYPSEDMAMFARSTTKRRINNGRVRLFGLSWSSSGLASLGDKLKNKTHNNQVEVMYDNSDLSTVWVRDPDDKQIIFQADATKPHFQNALTRHELKLIKNVANVNESAPELSLIRARMDFHEELKTHRASSKKVRKTISRMNPEVLSPQTQKSFIAQKTKEHNKLQELPTYTEDDFPAEGFDLIGDDDV